MFRRLLGEDIELTTRLSPALGLVLADRGQIQQVLLNLVVNARDAMTSGGRLAIETAVVKIDSRYAAGRPELTCGQAVVLKVTDTGHGMDEETKQHIFEPFFTTKGLAKGTGLGLATVYGIVKQSQGWIQVQSEIGKGSCFEVYLPQAERDDAEEANGSSSGATLRGSETVLVVEDQAEVRAFAKSALMAYGYQVIDAPDAKQALALSGSYAGPIHVLLTDVVLPGMNGRELADRIKGMRPEVAVVYTSGYTDDVITHRGVLDVGVVFVPKPYTADDIVEKVREALKR